MAASIPTAYNGSAAARTHLNLSPNASNAPPSPSSHNPQPPLPFAPLFRTHQIIGIYKASRSDLTLALSATDANPLCYVSTHTYSRPHMQLLPGSGSSSGGAELASAEFRHFSSSTTITASAGTTSATAAGPVTEQLERDGILGGSAWAIHMTVPASGERERFEWRASAGPEVRLLEGRRRGLELVRVGTGEVMAVYAGVAGWSTKKVGKFRWVGGAGGRTDVGDAGELLCVMSLLAVLEKARRSRRRSSAAVSAGAAVTVS